MKEPKKRPVFVDTNIFLRAIVKENKETYSECLSFLKKVSDGKIKAVTSTLVFLEINFALLSFYKFPKEKVQQALESIFDLPHLKIIDAFDLREAIETYKKTKIKFTDCLLASLLKKKDLKIVSYDLDFDKLKIKRLTPKDFLQKHIDIALNSASWAGKYLKKTL